MIGPSGRSSSSATIRFEYSDGASGMIETFFSHFKKVSIIAVLASMLGSLLMFIIGAVKVGRAYDAYFLMAIDPDSTPKIKVSLAIAYLVQAIDAFLIALILMIFGYGIYVLFIADKTAKERGESVGFNIRSIGELKKILADMIVIILMVNFLEFALTNTTGFDWTALILPGAILLLAGAVRVLKLED